MAITPIDASIPLQGINPITTMKDIAQANDLGSQMALRQQQAKNAQTIDQQNQIALQQQQMDVADQAKIRDYMSDPANSYKVAGGDMSGLYGLNVQPKTVAGVNQTFLDLHKKAADAKKEDLENTSTMTNALADTITGLQTLPENQRAAAYPGAISSLRQRGLVPPGANLPEVTGLDLTDKGLTALSANLAVGKAVAEQGLKMQGEQSTIAKTQADTRKAEADAIKSQTDAANTAAGIPKTKADAQIEASRAANQTSGGLLPDEEVKRQQAAAQLAHEQFATDQLGKYQRGELSLKQFTANLEADKNSRENKIYEQTYGAGANPALVGVDPKSRNAAQAAMNKEAERYQGSLRSSEDLQALTDLAKNGNKVAGTNLPMVTVGVLNAVNGIKRMNRAEIDQNVGAGNLWDQIVGKADKLVIGQPVPPDILAATTELNSKLAAQAAKGHEDRVNGINQTFRSNFQPIKSAAAGGKSTTDPNAPANLPPPPPSHSSANLPTKLSQSDVGKTYINKDGKSIRITAVNPADGSQFKAVEEPQK